MRKILVVGSGGREHALIWKLLKGDSSLKIYACPGNGGISEIAECVNIKSDDVLGVVKFATDSNIDLVIVTPDDPLALGMVDALEKAGIRAFGPSKEGAKIEWSKSYSKWLMKKYQIPTADFFVFDDAIKAKIYLEDASYPLVVKADGLALGKGVIICNTKEEGKKAIDDIMIDKKFADAGKCVVVEEFISGPEVSVLAFCDGKTVLPMLSAQDHKRAKDKDEGLNTGGMGTFSPSPKYTKEIAEFCEKEIFNKTLQALNSEGVLFKGIIFFGLMLTNSGVKVLEYNARLGDPETQVVLPLLKNNLIEIIDACIDQKLSEITLNWEDKSAVCVVMASGGYPEKYQTGYEITGLDAVCDAIVFHAGTKKEGTFTTNGGRVLGVTAVGTDINEAREKAYKNVEKIAFEGAHHRKDIGLK